MKKYWWVNHKQTFSQEIDGGYLWSPKSEKDGVRSQFYQNMRLASPGDFVLSFANATIGYVGQVSDYALTGAKPVEFGGTGEYWPPDGWLLPVRWKQLRNSIRPKNFIDEFRRFLPPKYSPMNAQNGNGNQKAYLAEISLDLFRLLLTKAGLDLDLVFDEKELASVFGDYAEQLDQAIERQLAMSSELSATEKSQLITSRRGQGLFRLNVSAHEPACRLTGITNPYFLIASHIKPWRSCATSYERLDGNNGLLLTPHVDLLFDRGFITFQNDGGLTVSSRMAGTDLFRLGITVPIGVPPKIFTEEQSHYLYFHRENVFLR